MNINKSYDNILLFPIGLYYLTNFNINLLKEYICVPNYNHYRGGINDKFIMSVMKI